MTDQELLLKLKEDPNGWCFNHLDSSNERKISGFFSNSTKLIDEDNDEPVTQIKIKITIENVKTDKMNTYLKNRKDSKNEEFYKMLVELKANYSSIEIFNAQIL